MAIFVLTTTTTTTTQPITLSLAHARGVITFIVWIRTCTCKYNVTGITIIHDLVQILMITKLYGWYSFAYSYTNAVGNTSDGLMGDLLYVETASHF